MDLRKEIRKILFEFFDKPSKDIDRNLNLDISYEYVYPSGINKKMLEKIISNVHKAQDSKSTFSQEQKIDKMVYQIVYLFLQQNPDLLILKSYIRTYFWHIFNGIISNYNPEDILFFITHPGGFANSSIRNYTQKVQSTFKKFPFKFEGGYLPSPKSFEKIKKALKITKVK